MSRQGKKRVAMEAAVEDDQAMAEGTVSIRLAEGEPVDANWPLLLAMSSVLAAAPLSPAWDLSSLRIDGEPVNRDTLVDWLNMAHTLLYDQPFDASAAERIIKQYPATRLYRLLAFADAVGSPPGLLRACVSGLLERVTLALQLSGRDFKWPLDCTSCFFAYGELRRLSQDPQGTAAHKRLLQAASPADIEAMRRQMAAQLEQLLYIGHKLKLRELLATVDAFISKQTMWKDKAVLTQALLPHVFSARVMAAAGSGCSLGACTMGGTPFSFSGSSGLVLKPVGMSAMQKQPISFNAAFSDKFMCWAAGATVPVQLHLFGSSGAAAKAPCIVVDGATIPIRLVM